MTFRNIAIGLKQSMSSHAVVTRAVELAEFQAKAFGQLVLLQTMTVEAPFRKIRILRRPVLPAIQRVTEPRKPTHLSTTLDESCVENRVRVPRHTAAEEAMQRTAETTGLPVTDVIRYGSEPLVRAVLDAEADWRARRARSSSTR